MKRLPLRAALAALAAASTLVPSLAEAHFTLVAPECSRSQDPLGSPQKKPPCGDEAGGTDTAKVTAFKAGDTIDVTIDETIFHPGHYRIALAVNDRSELPAEPKVTAGTTACGSVPIDPNPTFPVLADGVLAHTTAFTGPQTVKVKLPSNIECAHCTLQVIEFMSEHGLNNPGGCFYHHCADIAIQGASVDAGPTPPPDASTSPSGGSSDGCSVSIPGTNVAAKVFGAPALLLAVVALLRRRRRER